MESVIPDDSGAGPGTLGSGRVEGRLGRLHLGMDESNVTSWKDVVVLVARSESLQRVARGILWLLFSAFLAVSVLVWCLAALFVVVAFQRSEGLLDFTEEVAEVSRG
jgi:hypothetical protein